MTVEGGWDFDGRVAPRYLVTGTIELRGARFIGFLWQQENPVGSTFDEWAGR